MRYAVTGATGFIGGAVARQLIAAGHRVVAVARRPDQAGDLAALGVEIVRGDVTDKDSLRPAMTGADGVFHIAAQYEIGVRDAARMARVNVDGTRHVCELMRELHIPKGVYTSTVGVFSDTHGRMVDETYRYEGPFLSAYERTKWQAHYQVAEPAMRAGLPLVTVMPALVYGPGDHSLIYTTLRLWARGWLKIIPGGIAYCWGHVEDTARAHLLAMERGTPGESYIIAGPPATLDEALRLGEDLFGIPAPRLHVSPSWVKRLAAVLGVVEKVIPLRGLASAETLRTVAGVTYLASSAKAQRDLGLTMRPLAEGLAATVEHEMARMNITPRTRPPVVRSQPGKGA